MTRCRLGAAGPGCGAAAHWQLTARLCQSRSFRLPTRARPVGVPKFKFSGPSAKSPPASRHGFLEVPNQDVECSHLDHDSNHESFKECGPAGVVLVLILRGPSRRRRTSRPRPGLPQGQSRQPADGRGAGGGQPQIGNLESQVLITIMIDITQNRQSLSLHVLASGPGSQAHSGRLCQGEKHVTHIFRHPTGPVEGPRARAILQFQVA